MDPHKHNYFKKVWALYTRGELPVGFAGLFDIHHDDWCKALRGGYCDCDPEVRPVRLSALGGDDTHNA